VPRNSSGVYSLPIAPFVPGTVISSSAVNSDFSDIATALTGSVASNGVTTITGQLKSSITASPAYSGTVDLTSGFGVSAAGTAAIYAGGGIVGTFSSSAAALTVPLSITGNLTVSGSITAASFNFSGTGAIQIPAGTTAQRPASPVQGDIRYNQSNQNFEGYDGTEWQVMSGVSQRYRLSTSVSGGVLTVTFLNDLTGLAPTAADPVAVFVNQGAGQYAPILVTAALSINTNAVGATLGTSNNVPFRFWVVAFENAGAIVLALINCVNGTQIVPLNEEQGHSATGMSAAATSAGVFYCPNGTTITTQSFATLGYLEYGSGLAAAGNYASNPTILQLYKLGIKKPGDTVQEVFAQTGSAVGNNTGSFIASNVTATITPTSAANLVDVDMSAYIITGGSAVVTAQPRRGTSTNVGQAYQIGTATNIGTPSIPAAWGILDSPGTVAATAYTLYFNNSNGNNSNVQAGHVRLREIMG
jgi:hypothetical protein